MTAKLPPQFSPGPTFVHRGSYGDSAHSAGGFRRALAAMLVQLPQLALAQNGYSPNQGYNAANNSQKAFNAAADEREFRG